MVVGELLALGCVAVHGPTSKRQMAGVVLNCAEGPPDDGGQWLVRVG